MFNHHSRVEELITKMKLEIFVIVSLIIVLSYKVEGSKLLSFNFSPKLELEDHKEDSVGIYLNRHEDISSGITICFR